MTTNIGFMVHRTTGRCVPLEKCLIVSGSALGPSIVVDKETGFRYDADENWTFVAGASHPDDGREDHPAFRGKMMRRAMEEGRKL